MFCNICRRPMTALFTSWVCDYCDGLKQVEFPYHGFVVWKGEPDPAGRDTYVFPTREDAELYRASTNLDDHQVREVWCERPFRWQSGKGNIRGLRLADHLYTIFPDHRFTPAKHRARLAPEESSTSASP